MAKKLTEAQTYVLRSLIESGSWSQASGWKYGGHTERVLIKLVERGLVTCKIEEVRHGDHFMVYRPVKE